MNIVACQRHCQKCAELSCGIWKERPCSAAAAGGRAGASGGIGGNVTVGLIYEESVCGRQLNNIETTFSQVGATSAQRTAQRSRSSTREPASTCGGALSGCVRRRGLESASGGAQEGEARTELPYRAGFYGDLRKAVTRSGSFSGLISVLPQRRTCVQPPPQPLPHRSLPSPLNPTSMAGHRQPIKPGLGGYLHTLG